MRSEIKNHEQLVRHLVVTTKFIGPTNCRGSRVKATGPAGEYIVLDWNHAQGVQENHLAAASALLARQSRRHSESWRVTGYGWHDKIGYVFTADFDQGEGQSE